MGLSDGAVKGDVTVSGFRKLRKADSSWDRDQLGDVLHWIRQAIAVVCGIMWGVVPVSGVLWIALYLALSSGAVFGVYSLYLKVDEEDFGGHGALLQEGLFASVTLFLLAWTLVFSLAHY